MNFEVAVEMQKICTGETRELTRGQIASEVLDIDKLTKGFKPEVVEKCRAFYEELIKSGEKKMYDIDMLLEETESVKAEFDAFLKGNRGSDICKVIYDALEEFFQVPPFDGLDNIEYGVHEVCVFSILEYFIWKTAQKHDHEGCRSEYRDSIAERTYEEVGGHWIEVYDDLQKRYDALEGDLNDPHSFRLKLISCCILAIAAIRDQDSFALDMAQSGAGAKAGEIAAMLEDDSYKEGESSFTDNAVKLYTFVNGQLRELGEMA